MTVPSFFGGTTLGSETVECPTCRMKAILAKAVSVSDLVGLPKALVSEQLSLRLLVRHDVAL